PVTVTVKSADQCPDRDEDQDGYQDEDGCPDPDNDGDLIADTTDQCPNEPETYNGTDDTDGCPDHSAVVVTSSIDYILDHIYFRRGEATLQSHQLPIVDETAAVFKAQPELVIEVTGHCDKIENSQALSFERAQTVARELILRGVSPKALRIV